MNVKQKIKERTMIRYFVFAGQTLAAISKSKNCCSVVPNVFLLHQEYIREDDTVLCQPVNDHLPVLTLQITSRNVQPKSVSKQCRNNIYNLVLLVRDWANYL